MAGKSVRLFGLALNSMVKNATLIFVVFLLFAAAANGQRTPTKDEVDRAQLVLSRALNSESDAEHHSVSTELP